MYRFLLLLLPCLGWGPTSSVAQKLEHFDILLFTLFENVEGVPTANAPRFLTAFNPTGYNNQPRFFSNYELYLTVQLPEDTTQTDILSLDLAGETHRRVTFTPGLSEYSPTPMPDGKHFSAIRVEADGMQRLWMFPIDRSNTGRPLIPDLTGVGYHCWLNTREVAIFQVGEPHVLLLADLESQKSRRIASNIGRCLLKTPSGKLAFVQKATEQTWFIKEYDPMRQSSDIVVQTLPGSEDFAILPDGAYLAGSDSKLYYYKPGKSSGWRVIADLSKYGVYAATRLALSPDGRKLAVVVQY